jgi:Bifunctional DNA primase/polymerase, N-terminal
MLAEDTHHDKFEAALMLRALGIGTLPAKDKAPALEEWASLQERLATDSELASHHKNGADLAIINGAVSRNLETCDIERRAVAKRLLLMIARESGGHMLDKLVVATSLKGFHLYYRVPHSRNGTVWARDERGAKLIETRGEGQIAVVPPAPGRAIIGGRWENVRQPLSWAEAALLERLARAQHVAPPDPRIERDLLVQGLLTSTKLPAPEKTLLIALLHELSFTEWRDTKLEVIAARYGLCEKALRTHLKALVKRGLVAHKWEPYYEIDERGGQLRRTRHWRRLNRDEINEYSGNFYRSGDEGSGQGGHGGQDKEFFRLFQAHVSCRTLVDVNPRTHKFLATWRAEEHPSCHLYPPDETCPHEHWYDYGDPYAKHRDSFDLYCLTNGHYSYQDGKLRLDKKAAYPGARALLERLLPVAAKTDAGVNEPGGPHEDIPAARRPA